MSIDLSVTFGEARKPMTAWSCSEPGIGAAAEPETDLSYIGNRCCLWG